MDAVGRSDFLCNLGDPLKRLVYECKRRSYRNPKRPAPQESCRRHRPLAGSAIREGDARQNERRRCLRTPGQNSARCEPSRRRSTRQKGQRPQPRASSRMTTLGALCLRSQRRVTRSDTRSGRPSPRGKPVSAPAAALSLGGTSQGAGAFDHLAHPRMFSRDRLDPRFEPRNRFADAKQEIPTFISPMNEKRFLKSFARAS